MFVVTEALVLDPANTRTFCGVLDIGEGIMHVNMNLKVIGCKDMDWSCLAQDRIQ
jgi:hypothetical protein